jgi:hypothetical protein
LHWPLPRVAPERLWQNEFCDRDIVCVVVHNRQTIDVVVWMSLPLLRCGCRNTERSAPILMDVIFADEMAGLREFHDFARMGGGLDLWVKSYNEEKPP